MPMACLMNASAPCDTSYGGWQAPMVAAVANGSATPVLQDDGAAWSAIRAGHDDVVLYGGVRVRRCEKNVADVEDDAGFRAVAVLAGAAAAPPAAPASAARRRASLRRRRRRRGGGPGYWPAIFLSSFLTGGLVVRFYVWSAGAVAVRSDDDDDDDDFDDIAL
ncbi:hypothetical protein JL720_13769 [Aureococcus anophagefferens]|nr:hypothetical protein JL720_13769 [Aureococcus anophagefferens]